MNIEAALAAAGVLLQSREFETWWVALSMKERIDYLTDMQLAIEQEVY